MPITPFHFGLGLAAKAALMRRFSLSLFVLLQVVIDLETLTNLLLHRYPIHTFLHTFVGATGLAVVATAIASPVWVWWLRRSGIEIPGKVRFVASILATSLFATWSHVALDSIMHSDAEPFWPFTATNPLLHRTSVESLHIACAGLAILGLMLLAFRYGSEPMPVDDEAEA